MVRAQPSSRGASSAAGNPSRLCRGEHALIPWKAEPHPIGGGWLQLHTPLHYDYYLTFFFSSQLIISKNGAKYHREDHFTLKCPEPCVKQRTHTAVPCSLHRAPRKCCFPPGGLGPSRAKAALVPASPRASAALAGGQALSRVLPQTQADLAGRGPAALILERGERTVPPKDGIFRGAVPGAAGPLAIPSHLHGGGWGVGGRAQCRSSFPQPDRRPGLMKISWVLLGL